MEAAEQFDAALRLVPGYAEPLMGLTRIVFAEKRPDAALARVKKQVALEPKSGNLHYLMGTVHVTRGETAAAEAPRARP